MLRVIVSSLIYMHPHGWIQVVNYINKRARSDVQLIVISLKEELFNKADALVGVYPKSTVPCIASGILTYDLSDINTMMESATTMLESTTMEEES